MCSRIRENNKNKVGPVIWDTLYYPSIKTADSSRDEDEGKLHERLELRESALSIVWSLISKGSASDSPPEVRQLVTITKHQSSQFIVPPFHHVFLINIHLTHHSLLPPHPHVLTLSYIIFGIFSASKHSRWKLPVRAAPASEAAPAPSLPSVRS